ncbi:hypothetical protein BKA57DRAFT_305452 [Linnemannia elongata]|nr:hypothetical protein BKA57DRAFT_305452 [Linnemannia elongata]
MQCLSLSFLSWSWANILHCSDHRPFCSLSTPEQPPANSGSGSCSENVYGIVHPASYLPFAALFPLSLCLFYSSYPKSRVLCSYLPVVIIIIIHIIIEAGRQGSFVLDRWSVIEKVTSRTFSLFLFFFPSLFVLSII